MTKVSAPSLRPPAAIVWTMMSRSASFVNLCSMRAVAAPRSRRSRWKSSPKARSLWTLHVSNTARRGGDNVQVFDEEVSVQNSSMRLKNGRRKSPSEENIPAVAVDFNPWTVSLASQQFQWLTVQGHAEASSAMHSAKRIVSHYFGTCSNGAGCSTVIEAPHVARFTHTFIPRGRVGQRIGCVQTTTVDEGDQRKNRKVGIGCCTQR